MVAWKFSFDHTKPTHNMIISSLVFLFITSVFFRLLRRSVGKNSKKCGLPPGPTPCPIVGSLLTMLRNKPYFRWVLGVAEGKDITCIRLGGVHTIVVNSPEIGREFLKKHDASFASRPITMATEYSGRGFLSVVVSPWGDQWKKMRRIIASDVLSSTRLRQQEKLRVEEADILINFLYKKCKQQQQSVAKDAIIDIRKAVRYYTGNVIRRIIFGQRCFREGSKSGEEEEEHVEEAFTILSLIYAFNPSDFIPSLRWFDLDGHERIIRRAIKVINKYHDPIIEERIKRRRDIGDVSSGGGKEMAVDALDIMISVKDNDGKPLLTMEEIKAQSAELVIATVDNPSNIAEWALAHLLDQPDVLQKAVEELDRVVGKDRLVQESDFPQLEFIKACARESLRLHPVAPFNLPHVALHDTTVAGYFIPKGSQVLLSRVGLGRNPKVWDDPLRFDPTRHLGSTNSVELAEPDLRFISFTTGRRGCMGYALGSMMTYMLLARLLQAFEWRLAPGETGIDLSEEKNSLFMAKPLLASATPRLSPVPLEKLIN